MKRTHGFTLIELMIVVGIIAILVAIAVPGLIRSRVQTNECAAIENLRSVSAAQIAFNAAKTQFAGFDTLTSEVDGAGTAFLNGTWTEGGERQGYRYSMESATQAQFVCFAEPAAPGTTGVRNFRVDASGLIRWNANGRPTDSDPVIGTVQ